MTDKDDPIIGRVLLGEDDRGNPLWVEGRITQIKEYRAWWAWPVRVLVWLAYIAGVAGAGWFVWILLS